MPSKYLSEIVYCDTFAKDIFSITILSETLAGKARAGQFLHVKCGHSRILRRPISICSVRGASIEFVFEVKGEGTRWLSKRKPGDKLDVLGPLGNGFSFPDGNIIIAGGGMGAPPMLFAAESARGGSAAVLGFRNKDRVILTKEFEAICETVVLATDDGSLGYHGNVAAPLKQLIESGKYSAVLACGSQLMLSAVANTCKQYNMPCQVSLEERMGCGVGACLVCACATVKNGKEDMSRVCADGPVFDASELMINT